jgi:hypothetical protein
LQWEDLFLPIERAFEQKYQNNSQVWPRAPCIPASFLFYLLPGTSPAELEGIDGPDFACDNRSAAMEIVVGGGVDAA